MILILGWSLNPRRMKRLLIPLACLVVIVAELASIVIVLFWNPLNWKNYRDMVWLDWVGLVLSNVSIVAIALSLILLTVRVFRKIWLNAPENR